VDIVAKWKKDEIYSVKIVSTIDDFAGGAKKEFKSTFSADFKIVEAGDSGYVAEWTFKNAKLAVNDPAVENHVISALGGIKLLIELSDTGQFAGLSNYTEVKPAVVKIVDALLSSTSSDVQLNAEYKAMRQLLDTKQGLEIALLKPIKFYYFSFGYTYELNKVTRNDIQFPNPLGGFGIKGVENVVMTKLDRKNSICVIETNKVIDAQLLKTAIIDWVRKASNNNSSAVAQIQKLETAMSENTMQEIDFTKGILRKSFFKRVMHLGFQNRTTLLEVETVM